MFARTLAPGKLTPPEPWFRRLFGKVIRGVVEISGVNFGKKNIFEYVAYYRVIRRISKEGNGKGREGCWEEG